MIPQTEYPNVGFHKIHGRAPRYTIWECRRQIAVDESEKGDLLGLVDYDECSQQWVFSAKDRFTCLFVGRLNDISHFLSQLNEGGVPCESR